MQRIAHHENEGREIIYLDESGFAQSMPRRNGYSAEGTRCYGSHDWHAKGRINAIGAIVGMTFLTLSLFSSGINSDVFYAWLTQDLLPKVKPNTVIVMDNATFHKRSDMLEAITKHGCIAEFLPPYSPDLNPIEKKWAQAKSIRRKLRCSIDELFTTHLDYRSLCWSSYIYSVSQKQIRELLVKTNQFYPNQKRKPIQNPTLRWILRRISYDRICFLEQDGEVIDTCNVSQASMMLFKLMGKELLAQYALNWDKDLASLHPECGWYCCACCSVHSLKLLQKNRLKGRLIVCKELNGWYQRPDLNRHSIATGGFWIHCRIGQPIRKINFLTDRH